MQLRRSWPARIAALGFILIFLFGNFWFVYVLVGDPAPHWLHLGFGAGAAMAACGGVGLGALATARFLGWIKRTEDAE